MHDWSRIPNVSFPKRFSKPRRRIARSLIESHSELRDDGQIDSIEKVLTTLSGSLISFASEAPCSASPDKPLKSRPLSIPRRAKSTKKSALLTDWNSNLGICDPYGKNRDLRREWQRENYYRGGETFARTQPVNYRVDLRSCPFPSNE